MRLAREFCRPDWRTMLAGMSSTELGEWSEFYRDNYFCDSLLDAHFSNLSYLVISTCCKHELTPEDFSLFNKPAPDEELDGEQLMSLAESLSGGVRYGPVSG